MTHFSNSRYFIWFCVYLPLVISTILANSVVDDSNVCPGPLAFYEDLNCTPIFSGSEFCPVRYNCSHLINTSNCYLNGHVYEIGQEIRDEDKNPCEEGCTCIRGNDGIAEFYCPPCDGCSVNEFPVQDPNKTCYPNISPLACCTKNITFVESRKDLPTCEAFGKTFVVGKIFTPQREHFTWCTCLSGEGQNKYFCISSNRRYKSDINAASRFLKQCYPYYRPGIDRFHGLETRWMCRESFDNSFAIGSSTGYNRRRRLEIANLKDAYHVLVCRYHKIILRHQEELHLPLISIPYCVKCICEVPPVPTCSFIRKQQCRLPSLYWENMNITGPSEG